jgi:MFS family permease
MIPNRSSQRTKGENYSMNIKNLIISSLIGGIVIAALANIPVINLINCLLCIGYWAGAILAVWLYKKFEGSLTLGQGVAVGALAGFWSGLINFILGLISAAGIATLITTLNQILPPDTLNLQPDYAGRLAILFNLIGVFLNLILGTLGGLIGGAIFQTRPEAGDMGKVEPVLQASKESAAEQIADQSVPGDEEMEDPPAEAS